MTLEQVRHVLEVEKAKSINQAANNMFLSQSALSLSIKALEQEFGQDIFIRNSKGVALTPFGRTFISYVRPIQLQINQLYSLRKGNAARHMLSLKVASNGFRFVSSVLAQIYQKYKSMGIRIENFDCVGDDALYMVSDKLVEIGVIRFWSCYKPLYYKQFEAKSLQFFSMAKKPLCVLVGRGSPLYTLEQNSISAEELAGYPMVMHDYMDCGPYSDILDRLGLAVSPNCIITSSRAVIHDILDQTDAYYLSSDFQNVYKHLDGRFGNISSDCTHMFLLTGTEIQSEIGWIKHSSYNPSTLAGEFVSMMGQSL